LEKNIWQAYRKKGVQVIGLNVWEKGEISKVKGFIKKHRLTYLVLIDKDEKVFSAYTTPRGVPTNAVIDRKGKIVYLSPGFNESAVLAAVQNAMK
jgi:peroxiredoxin